MSDNIILYNGEHMTVDIGYIINCANKNKFTIIERRYDGIAFAHPDGLVVILSGQFEKDHNKRWIHVSMSRKNKLPSYKDIMRVKNIFIGEDKQAIQIFPKWEKHINIMKHCLHLWYCLDGDCLPDFTHGGNSI